MSDCFNRGIWSFTPSWVWVHRLASFFVHAKWATSMKRNKNWTWKMKENMVCVYGMCDLEKGRFSILMGIITLTQPWRPDIGTTISQHWRVLYQTLEDFYRYPPLSQMKCKLHVFKASSPKFHYCTRLFLQLLFFQLLQVRYMISWTDRYFLPRIETVRVGWRYVIVYVGKGETWTSDLFGSQVANTRLLGGLHLRSRPENLSWRKVTNPV